LAVFSPAVLCTYTKLCCLRASCKRILEVERPVNHKYN